MALGLLCYCRVNVMRETKCARKIFDNAQKRFFVRRGDILHQTENRKRINKGHCWVNPLILIDPNRWVNPFGI